MTTSTAGTATIWLLGSVDVPPGESDTIEPLGLNRSGAAAGYSQTETGLSAFLWANGTNTGLPGSAGFPDAEAYGINDAGEVVGGVGKQGNITAALWSAGSASAPTLLPGLPGSIASIAAALNNSGLAVGSSYASTSVFTAVEWQNGQISALPSLGGTQSAAYAVNQSGEIVGSATTDVGTSAAVIWVNGQITRLSTLWPSGSANGINASGAVVGAVSYGGVGNNLAMLWQNGQAITLGSTHYSLNSVASGINDQGVVVGYASLTGDVGESGVAWYDGVVFKLSDFLSSSASATWASLGPATGINDANQVIGYGFTESGGVAAFELDLPSQLKVSAALATSDYQLSRLYAPVIVTDSAAGVANALSGLKSMAGAGDLASITLTDTGTPNLTVTAAQFAADATALNDITSAHAVTVQMTGNAAQHNFTGENWTGASALQFADQTVIVAATPGGANAVTTGNVTELYSAVLAREPDVSGLAFYQNYLKSNPTTSLQTFAEFFLNSTEYTSAHSYAQTTAGETQFITDSYQNLLHRTPSADEVNFYLTNVLEKPGTQLQNHALMLVYFSASTEFLGDVQITAANPASAAHWLLLT